MRLGSAMRPFMMSAKVHTTSSSVTAPTKITTTNRTRYGVTATRPNNRSMFRSP
jgi:hypothetical protein